MALVRSTFILSIGSQAPGFVLPEPKTGKLVSLAEVKGVNGTLVVFTCNHCPYVVHLAKELGLFGAEVAALGVNTVAISSNEVVNYPQDDPEKMVEFSDESGWDFPYLYDESQEVAQAYSAACTPDFFLFDASGKLYYAGQFDDSRPGDELPVDAESIRSAVQQMLIGEPFLTQVKPATGCNIKWRLGNEPKYFGWIIYTSVFLVVMMILAP